MPSGKSFRRHACTKRRPGTRSTFTPVTCPASVENLPPILSLMTAFRPVTSVRLRESASRSYMAFGGALRRTLCLMVLHIPHSFFSSTKEYANPHHLVVKPPYFWRKRHL